jgi:cytochrome c biogenesis protein CcmG, thiol:disulfide interchange protein DsbE
MKHWFSKKTNILFLLVMGFVLFQWIPVIQNNLKHKNLILDSTELKVYGAGETVFFPPEDKRVIAFFWASWCGPCKIEMERLKLSVNSGSIPRERIFGINLYESPEVVESFLKKNDYPFTFIESPRSANQLEVRVTPTTMLIDKGKIVSMSSGMSIWGIWWAEYFLRGSSPDLK